MDLIEKLAKDYNPHKKQQQQKIDKKSFVSSAVNFFNFWVNVFKVYSHWDSFGQLDALWKWWKMLFVSP